MTDSKDETTVDWKAKVQEMAELDAGDYETVRIEVAEFLGWRVSVLDEKVDKARGGSGMS